MKKTKRTLLVLSGSARLVSTRRLLAEGRRAGYLVECLDPLKARVVTGPQAGVYRGRRHIAQPDCVLARTGTLLIECGLSVARSWELAGSRVVNAPQAIAWSKNKMLQLQDLHGAGLPVPRSLLTHHAGGLSDSLRMVGGPPLVLKTLHGSQGLGVMLAETEGAAASMVETLWGLERDVMLQQYIPAARTDVRCFVVGGEVVAAIRRTARRGEFRSNVHRGAKTEVAPTTGDAAQLARRAARVLKLDVAGVDLVEDADGWIVLEVNTTPGLGAIERVTGVNVAGAMVDFVVRSGKGC